jgi:putative addiction module component (TIGR02574 family)
MFPALAAPVILMEQSPRGDTTVPTTVESLGIDQLTVRERLELIEQIWDSLPECVNSDEIPRWHFAELAKRRAEADATPGAGKPWREALSRFEGDPSRVDHVVRAS